ncbi:hypothetical protein [Streptomyces sp. NBC_01012]|uniref:hypothetical protein n=1 Tax=Streptomyces sp. NBC_01012 TaxID=2903717 RepID=UPI00386A2600|nr:hypothetical protein OG623_00920 [Streptomyces sp. NBC_01012]
MGSIVNPQRDLHALPIALVSSTTGEPRPGDSSRVHGPVSMFVFIVLRFDFAMTAHYGRKSLKRLTPQPA